MSNNKKTNNNVQKERKKQNEALPHMIQSKENWIPVLVWCA